MSAAVELVAASVERGGARIVHKVSLTVKRGTWFGLIGANGSGKTSLLRAVAGRLPFAGGSCRIEGDELAGDRAARAERCGFAPPPDRLPDALRVADLFELVGGRVDRAWPRLGPLRAALGLDGLLGRWIGDCSAGMRQRVALATAFLEGRPLVILDEPFNWLDPVAAFDLRQALRAMTGKGLTVITALHDLTTLTTACDRGLMLADGHVALELDEDALQDAAHDPQGFERRMIDVLRQATG